MNPGTISEALVSRVEMLPRHCNPVHLGYAKMNPFRDFFV